MKSPVLKVGKKYAIIWDSDIILQLTILLFENSRGTERGQQLYMACKSVIIPSYEHRGTEGKFQSPSSYLFIHYVTKNESRLWEPTSFLKAIFQESNMMPKKAK